jgi:hypothetical protein
LENRLTTLSELNNKKVKKKGKVVPVLLTEHHTMKAYWGVEV